MTALRMIVLFLLGLLLSGTSVAQETIFNVPSGDVLDKGKAYGEFDFAYLWDASASTYTPRVVVGIGHQIEIGMNVNGITTPGPSQTTPTPTIKWRAYNKNGWALLLGDHLYVPVQNRTYDIGNYVYAEVTKSFESTPGAAIRLSSKATLYAAYEIGNLDVSHGNHLLLVELGWNFN